MEKKNQWNTGYWIVALLLLLSLQSYWQTAKTVEPVPYSEFEKALDGRVITQLKEQQRDAQRYVPSYQ